MCDLRDLRQVTIVPEPFDGFTACHASTLLALANGDLLCAFMAGSGEGNPDMAIWIARCVAGAWQPPVRVQHRYLLPHWNPVLHRAGDRVLLYYKVGLSVQDWYTLQCQSDDGGATWSCPAEAVPGDHTPRVCVRCKLLVDSRGRWIGPVSIEAGNQWDAFVDISEDAGRVWQKRSIPRTHYMQHAPVQSQEIWTGLAEGALWETKLETVMRWDGVIQPTLWESAPGHLHALMRSTRGRVYRSDSTDGGETWCEAWPTDLPNNNAGIDLVRLENGTLVLVYNPIGGNWGGRSPLSVSISRDNGATFSTPEHLETAPGEYSYPAIINCDNRLWVSYTSNRTNIVVASFGFDA